jgi:hypothetical protein
MPSSLQARTNSLPASVNPGPMSGEAGNTPAKGVGTTPGNAQRTQAQLVELLQIVQLGIYRLSPLKMQDDGQHLPIQAIHQFRDAAHNLDCALGGFLEAKQTSDCLVDNPESIVEVYGIGQLHFVPVLCSDEQIGFWRHRVVYRGGRDKDGKETASKSSFASAGQIEVAFLAPSKKRALPTVVWQA